MSVQRGLRDGRQLQEAENTYLCSGQSSRRAVLSISLSTAALRPSAGGLMFARTGSQGNGAECRYPAVGNWYRKYR